MQEVAYDVMKTEKANAQLFGAVESSWNKLDSFRDGALTVRSQDAWATDVTLGVRYNVVLTPLGSAPAGMFTVQTGAIGSVGDVNPAVKMRYEGYHYRQECAQRDRWGWEIGAGLEVPVSNNVSFFGTAEGIIRGDSNSFDAQVGMRVAF